MLLLTVLLTATIALATGCGSPPPTPPDLQDVGQKDEDAEVRDLLSQLHTKARKDPDDLGSWSELGKALEANGRFESARLVYEYASHLKGADARLYFRLAQTAMERQELDQALAAFRQARKLDPDYAPIAWRTGFLLHKINRLDEAQGEFERALALDTREAPAWVGLARVHLQRGEADKAITALKTLLEHHPGDSYARHLLGGAYREGGRLEDARRELERGNASPPVWLDPWNRDLAPYRVGFKHRYGEAQKALGQRQHQRAVPIFEELHERRPDSAMVAVGLAGSYVLAGRTNEAIVLLEGLVSEHPDDVDVRTNLAVAYRSRGELERALFHAQQALRIQPGNTNALSLQTSLQKAMSITR